MDYPAIPKKRFGLRAVVMAAFTTLCTCNVGFVHGQDFPGKPVRIVASAPGAANDLIARVIAHALTETTGRQVIVENRGGASGIVAVQTVAKAPPDGYTLLLYGASLWLLPYMQRVPYDPIKDFAPITLPVMSPNMIVVHPSLPVASTKDLINLARRQPGQMNYASGGSGSSNHLAAELFKSMAKVDLVRIAHKGGGPALAGLMSGETQVMFPSVASAMTLVKARKLKALAVASLEPSQLVPELPTVSSSGLQGYESTANFGIFAPERTPATIIDRLNREISTVLQKPDIRNAFLRSGSEVVGGTPDQLAAKIKSEMMRLGKVIKDAGIQSE